MNRRDKNRRFDALVEQITAQEAGVRRHFANTPSPSPQTVARIKSILRQNMATMPRSQARQRWAAWAGPVAATILVAAGAALLYRSVLMAPASKPATDRPVVQQASADILSLNAFAASLPKAMADEDPAIPELDMDLKELESQALPPSWSNG